MKNFIHVLLFLLIAGITHSQTTFVRDTEFDQEYHEPYPVSKNPGENDIRGITVDKESNVWIATIAGVLIKKNNETSWVNVLPVNDQGPAYVVAKDDQSVIWMGTWKGIFISQNGQVSHLAGTNGPISVLCVAKEGVYAIGPDGVWLHEGDSFIKKDYKIARSVRSAVSDGNKGIWIATDVGLYHCTPLKTDYFYYTDVLLSAYIRGVDLDNQNKLWAGGLGGVTILENNKKEKELKPKNGIPSAHVNCVKRSPDGTMWIGTAVGVVRFYSDGTHSLRFTRRWLLNDNVNDIAFDKDGNAWIATSAGVSAIRKKKMNLAAKQDYFYDILMKRHIREPWIAGQCRLATPGDITTWQPADDDNDGEFTGNYLAMESFRYAVTKSEDAREKAMKAFHFLKQLQEVTGGDGYFARSIVPADWPYGVNDANRKYTEKEIADDLVKEPRFKPIEQRWRQSKDGKWLWKGDASSDEWCGHMLGYFFYYQLAATEEEKTIVSKHVALLLDHLIANHFNMMDIDSTHTRWAVWSPDDLNRNPDWRPDKYQNSMELLTFLKLAYYMTGDNKYQQHYLRLIKEEHYLENMNNVPDQNPAWFVYYDVTMQAYLVPILLSCEKDPQLLSFYKKFADKWMAKRRNDKNPMINFLYCYGTNKKEELAASIEFLKDTPLDLVDWSVDHTKREDVKITRSPVLEEIQVEELPPASIRVAVRWDKNPWIATNGYPNMEREPVFWLFPYWMGRYLNMIR
ncbi:MAG: regulator [Bacteroidetes bacterium]|nr:regulator [Bacteroidota bacterium]